MRLNLSFKLPGRNENLPYADKRLKFDCKICWQLCEIGLPHKYVITYVMLVNETVYKII